jgi:hypothetical protein
LDAHGQAIAGRRQRRKRRSGGIDPRGRLNELLNAPTFIPFYRGR